ncbi:hypothetical protein HK103_006751 [Boothiomyces macroporosus]|uniref:P-type phospholipid transporter n=1 Tax=Boothiomyces macroporosus TaxID=261099 RepID=A0AAD5UDC0_9FUNG|nr:hypothetical protein HK103_006751 [Boothiomyces macroporosus]
MSCCCPTKRKDRRVYPEKEVEPLIDTKLSRNLTLTERFNRFRHSTVNASKSAGNLAPEHLCIFILTFNMNGRLPTDNLDLFFGELVNFKRFSNSHLVVVASQECEKMYNSKQQWEQIIDMYLEKEYVKLQAETLVQLNLVVYVKKQYISYVGQIQTGKLATGIGNVVGNKGAVGIAIQFGSSSILLVNAHMTAHEGKVVARNREFHRINSQLPLYGINDKDRRKMHVFDRYDYTFFIGDLNYRVKMNSGIVERLLKEDKINLILESDELNIEKAKGTILRGFNEAPINFRPTFKFDVEQVDTYNKKKQRVPSWTDRILFKQRETFSFFKTNSNCTIKCVEYDSIMDITSSDHKPDAFEDYKRHVSDNMVNHLPVYTLDNWQNYNIRDFSNSTSGLTRIKVIYKKIVKKILSPIKAMLSSKPDTKLPLTLNSNDYLKSNYIPHEIKPGHSDQSWKICKWKDIKVGDFVLLQNNNRIPADILIVSTSEPDSTCFVETKNLDGETNLKIKKGVAEFSHIRTPEDCKNLKFRVDAEIPNPNLYTFNGSITVIKENRDPQYLPIGTSGLLLRGCILRNTNWLIGLAVYTGPDTKIMLNSGPTPSKRSQVDRQMNPLSFLINQDLDMYDEESGKSALPKSWNLCDDLGQIEYIFSDKTGTLTSNVMEFKKASINGQHYGLTGEKNNVEEDKKLMISRYDTLYNCKYMDKNPGFVDSKIPLHLGENSIQSIKIREFFTLLAVCHTVLVEKNEDPKECSIAYRAQSPDEAALVSAAKDAGFVCLNRTDNKVEVDIMGQSRVYTILNIIEFTSDRKRMSVIARRPEGDLVLLCKGADSVIFDRLDPNENMILKEQTSIHLELFANEGLRTLCLAYKFITEDEYREWNEMYRKAQNLLVDREIESDKIANMMERNLNLMGATAIEDKLQDGVPQAIEILGKAGLIALMIMASLLPNVVIKYTQQTLYPNDTDLIQEIHKFKRGDVYAEEIMMKEKEELVVESLSAKSTEKHLPKIVVQADGFGVSPDRTAPSGKPRPLKADDRSRASSMSSISLAIKSKIQKATEFIKQIGQDENAAFLLSAPKARGARAGSLVYMDNSFLDPVPNTGYAFSHDPGMEEIITPKKFNLSTELDTIEEDGLEDLKRHMADNSVNNAHTFLLDNWANQNYGAAVSPRFSLSGIIKDLKKKFTGIFKVCYDTILANFKENSELKEEKLPEVLNANDYIKRSSVIDVAQSTKSEVWRKAQWKNIRVGDFILLRNNDSIPADLMIVASSEPEYTCFVETKNLDGETNLKIKRGLPQLAHIKTPEDCKKSKFTIEAEAPNANLYTFNGSIMIPSESEQDPYNNTILPLGPSSIVLRGCVLRNTSWLIGIAIYTGVDTKIMLNSGPTPSKRSQVDRQINPQIILNVVVLITLCGVCAIVSGLYAGSAQFEEYSYLGLDLDMYDEESMKLAQPKSWNLCDDLGQIEYIFSDKTGTLTSNVMEFKKASINGQQYGMVLENSIDPVSFNKKLKEERDLMLLRFKGLNTKYIDAEPGFVDSKIPLHLDEKQEQGRKIREFFTCLAVCHTVLVEKPESDSNKILYRAQSPDEAALVSAAKNAGFACLNRTDNKIEVDMLGASRTYTVLNIMEFNSDRKRMSVIIRRPEGEILLFCKGADSVIYERLDKSNSQELIDTTSQHLAAFANNGSVLLTQGLRTLCLAYRVISEDDYQEWNEKYRTAQALIENREIECDLIANRMEQNLILIGATAIEDKLQDGVPDAIATLAKAGIKLWVLTGDKVETAINIGFSCNLLQKSMVLIVIQSSSPQDTFDQLKEALMRFWDEKGHPKLTGEYKNSTGMATVIDGNSLKFALASPCKDLFLELGCRCKAVLCCRVSPLQKAMVVKLVREGLGAMCLAIGDGANDVSMIQEANIGIGISGKEGLQAVMASDYAISQFRFLTKLLLVHGRWAYMRCAELALNYFYKNIIWLFILFWDQFYCGFSSGLAMDVTYSMYFNTIFTFLPTIFIGMFDQDINATISMLIPEIYLKGIRQELYTAERFWIYCFHAIFQSIICYFGVIYIVSETSLIPQGLEEGAANVGTLMAFSAIIIINVYGSANWYSWSWLTHFSLYFSIAAWTLYLGLYSLSVDSPIYGIFQIFISTVGFWASMLLVVITSLIPRAVIKYVQQLLYPSDTDLLQETQYIKSTIQEIEALSPQAVKLPVQDSVDREHVTRSHENLPAIVVEKEDHPLDGFVSPKGDVVPRHKTLSAGRKKSIHKSSDFKHRVQRASQYFNKHLPHLESKHKPHRAGSLVYMGANCKEVTNNGFAFSQDEGMQDIITPRRAILDVIEENAVPKMKKRQPSLVPKLRNLSRSFQTVFGIQPNVKPTSTPNNSANSALGNPESVEQALDGGARKLSSVPPSNDQIPADSAPEENSTLAIPNSRSDNFLSGGHGDLHGNLETKGLHAHHGLGVKKHHGSNTSIHKKGKKEAESPENTEIVIKVTSVPDINEETKVQSNDQSSGAQSLEAESGMQSQSVSNPSIAANAEANLRPHLSNVPQLSLHLPSPGFSQIELLPEEPINENIKPEANKAQDPTSENKE